MTLDPSHIGGRLDEIDRLKLNSPGDFVCHDRTARRTSLRPANALRRFVDKLSDSAKKIGTETETRIVKILSQAVDIGKDATLRGDGMGIGHRDRQANGGHAEFAHSW